MAQVGKGASHYPDNLGLVPGIHKVEGENQLPQLFL